MSDEHVRAQFAEALRGEDATLECDGERTASFEGAEGGSGETSSGSTTSWHYHEPSRYLDSEVCGDPQPTVFRREDGAALFYRGQVNAVYGESGSLKSWIAQAAVAEVLGDGGSAIYYDFEANGGQIHQRLRDMGVEDDVLRLRFRYARPAEPLEDPGVADLDTDLTEVAPQLVVVDGVTDAMALHGLDPLSNKDYAVFDRLLAKRIAAHGPAVLLVDHVGRNGEGRRGHAIGAQHKRAAVTGAAYSVELRQPFGRGRHGVSHLKVFKDRSGHVDALIEPDRRIADVHFNSNPATFVVSVEVRRPSGAGGQSASDLRAATMERVSAALEKNPQLGVREVLIAVGGRSEVARQALQALVDGGYVEVAVGRRRKQLHTVVKPFRASDLSE